MTPSNQMNQNESQPKDYSKLTLNRDHNQPQKLGQFANLMMYNNNNRVMNMNGNNAED